MQPDFYAVKWFKSKREGMSRLMPCKVDSIDETDSVDFVADLMKACLI
jgi:hypothetical protein